MANSKTIAFNNVQAVARNMQEVAGLNSEKRGTTEQVNIRKVEAYAMVVADLAQAGAKVTKRGKKSGLPVKIMSAMRDELIDAGVSPAVSKRLCENSQGLCVRSPELLEVTDSTRIEVTLNSMGLNTESKIKNHAFPPEDDAELKAIARKIAKMAQDERLKLDEYVAVFAAELEAQALEQAKENGETLDAVFDVLEENAA